MSDQDTQKVILDTGCCEMCGLPNKDVPTRREATDNRRSAMGGRRIVIGARRIATKERRQPRKYVTTA